MLFCWGESSKHQPLRSPPPWCPSASVSHLEIICSAAEICIASKIQTSKQSIDKFCKCQRLYSQHYSATCFTQKWSNLICAIVLSLYSISQTETRCIITYFSDGQFPCICPPRCALFVHVIQYNVVCAKDVVSLCTLSMWVLGEWGHWYVLNVLFISPRAAPAARRRAGQANNHTSPRKRAPPPPWVATYSVS